MRHLALLLMTIITIVRSDTQPNRPNCVDGKARVLKNGTWTCDELMSAAVSRTHGPDPRVGFTGKWTYPDEILPYYSDRTRFEKDSSRVLPTCEVNADCEYLSGFSTFQTVLTGYCYPARNAATGFLVKDKKFCFAMKTFAYNSHYLIEPYAIGIQYCNTHADCSPRSYSLGAFSKAWFCKNREGVSDYNGARYSGVCINWDDCIKQNNRDFHRNSSLTLNGNECNSDQSCLGAGIASIDTANDYTPKCTPIHYEGEEHRVYRLCCQSQQPSCSVGLNFRPRTDCQSDDDCTKLSKNSLICDPDHKICCDVTVPTYLKKISFDHLVTILSNQAIRLSFYHNQSPILIDEFQKEFRLRFDENDINEMLGAHNKIRESIAKGTFRVHREVLQAAVNMKLLKWNQDFEAHAKAVAIKSCTQTKENYNVEVFTKNSPIGINGSPRQYAVQAVRNWETKLRESFNFNVEEPAMIAIPDKGIKKSVLQMIYDSVSEVGCAFTRCTPYGKNTPTIVCYYGSIEDRSYVYVIAE